MLGRNHYHRSFIILQSEDRGYGFEDGREPAGYCRLEVKKNRGKAYVYIQDIKPADDTSEIYEIILVSSKDEQTPQRLGILDVDDRGRGENIIEFDPSDVYGSGRTLDEFDGVAIALINQEHSERLSVNFPLVGYSNRRVEIDWTGRVASTIIDDIGANPQKTVAEDTDTAKDFMQIQYEEKDEKELVEELEKPQEKKKLEAVDESEDIIEHTIDESGDIAEHSINENQDIIEHTTYESDDRENTVEKSEPEKEQYDEQKDIEEEEKPPIEKIDEPEQEVDQPTEYENDNHKTTMDKSKEYIQKTRDVEKSTDDKLYWDKVEEYFTDLMDNNDPIDPFDEPIPDSRWVKVLQSGSYYTYPHDDHYIIGLVSDGNKIRHIIYGVPGPYGPKPPKGMDGFYCWKPAKHIYGMGYWLLFIDANTGAVVYPY